MKWNWKNLNVYVPYIVVGFVASLVIVINFPWHGTLIGWDNLTTEMNPAMNFWRNFSGVWQEYQGLGLLAGMSHASDLVRLLIQWFVSLLIPEQFLRSGMLLSMLLIGSLGMVKLFRVLSSGDRYGSWGAALAGLFYLLNFGTVQNFWAVFEPYAWAFGLVPWVFASLMLYLRNGSKRNLISLAIISLLATPMAYIQTIFLIYILLAFVICVGYVLTRDDIGVVKKMKRVFVGLFTILMVNSFWLLPQIYFTLTSVAVTVNAKMNLIATPEVELSNQARGNLLDVLKMRGYWLDLHDTDSSGGFYYLMDPWVRHVQQNWVAVLENIVVGLLFVGILTLFFKKNEYRWSVLMCLVLVVGILQNNNSPLGWSWLGIYDYLPILHQIFRSSFTKVVVFQSLLFSILLGYSLVGLLTMMGRIRLLSLWIVRSVVFGAITTVLVGVSYPIFQSNLLYKSVKLSVPAEYGNLNTLIDLFPWGRILKLPTQTLWGWQYNDWGYNGSGFLWYGIEQPILDRAFDVWSPYNERFYGEFSNVLYGDNGQCDSDKVTQCHEAVQKVLNKYDVRYVLLDESVIAPGQDSQILRVPETKAIMEEMGAELVFQENFLSVWDLGNSQITNSQILKLESQFISAPSSYTWVEADTEKVREDVVYGEVGTYISANRQIGKSVITYPFAGLMREEVEVEQGRVNIEYGVEGITLTSYFEETPPAFGVPTRDSFGSPVEESPLITIPGWEVGEIVRVDFEYGEVLPAYKVNGVDGPRFLGEEKPDEGESYFLARVSEGEEWNEYLGDKEFRIEVTRIEVEVAGAPHVYDFGMQGQGTIGNCDVLKRGEAEKSQSSDRSLTQVSELGVRATTYVADGRGAVCDYVVMDKPYTRLPYLMRIRGENVEGRSLKFFLWNTGSQRNDIEWLLSRQRTANSLQHNKFDSTFALLPWDWDGHYTLNIETRSFGQRAENRIEPVEVRYFPLEQIARARITNSNGETPPASGVPTRDSLGSPVEESPRIQSDLDIKGVKKFGTWLYIVETENGGLLKLSQGYDVGWVSPYLEHLKVDGWANGWIVPGGVTIVIFYWPQLLQYLGFVMLGAIFLIVLRMKT